MPTEEEIAIQMQLLDVADDLEALCARLEGVLTRLPASPLEGVMLAGEAENDVITEVRSAVECVLVDRLRPAIRSLQTAAAYKAGEEGKP